jgi:hypothetical protein
MIAVLRKRRWIYPLVLAVLLVMVFTPLLFSLTHYKAGEVTSDFPAFMELTEGLKQGPGNVPGYHLAHPLWELLVIAVNSLFGISFRMAAFLVTLSSTLAAAMVIYFWFAPVLRANRLSLAWGVVAAVGLNLVTPLSVLAPIDHRWFAGYIGTIQYNNPTIILLRPLALLQFIIAIRCFQQAAQGWQLTALAAAVTALATLAKPSFAICILPAMGLLAAYRWLKRQHVDARLLFMGFVAPTLAVLTWQFLVAYGSPGQSGIFLYPFGVMGAQSSFLLIKFLLSVFFPLLVVMILPRAAAHDIRMVLAWLSFFWGILFAYLFAFGPPLTLDGDFIWGARITLLLLFCVSLLFLLERIRTLRWVALLPGAAWLAHVAYGIAYYIHYLTTQKHI